MTCSRWLPNSTNLNQSQLSNTKPPAMYRKRRFEWSFRAAPHARLSAAPRASLAPLQRVHVLRVQLCLPNHPMLVTPTNTSTWSLTSVSREINPSAEVATGTARYRSAEAPTKLEISLTNGTVVVERLGLPPTSDPTEENLQKTPVDQLFDSRAVHR